MSARASFRFRSAARGLARRALAGLRPTVCAETSAAAVSASVGLDSGTVFLSPHASLLMPAKLRPAIDWNARPRLLGVFPLSPRRGCVHGAAAARRAGPKEFKAGHRRWSRGRKRARRAAGVPRLASFRERQRVASDCEELDAAALKDAPWK
ncbi:hypothetical protein IscW_ISCW017917 [Ixodes scapularis]|uniref:Uncharacterized protein n=1 Tax=Ixodes scapularis TaxID=6945 RepID=B7PJQ4_IXOSC|nr:hypothetical protein IscW_ISCW017917 [Ixodes scapularis]|eukprot:XP_002408393.1 hypothetical protein IscW_ISCW017917 [Ixodes scapularis]